MSEILFFAAEQINFFEQQQIDALIVRGNTDNHAVGALIAAQCSKRTKRVCIQHSGLGINKNIFPVFETCSYDYLWTRDELSEKYFKREQVELYPSDCKIYQSAHSAHESKASQKMRQLSRTKEQCILYLETRFPSHVRAFGNPTYPLTAYYEFQKSMIDFMLEQTTVRWIFKHAPRSDYQSPILEYIRRMKNSNIVVSSVHFTQCIDSCDKVFMDFFSTAFCESILAGKPTLCLGVEHFDWIPEMKSAFGESFRSFLNFEDARRHLLEFIGEPTTSSRFKPILPYKDESINKFLSEFFQSIRPVNNNGI